MERSFEQRLIKRARRGDMAAFEQLYRAHAPALTARIIRPRLARSADQEDVLVETFRIALERLSGFRGMGRGLFPWLARIAGNKCTDVHRASGRRGRAHEALRAEPLEQMPQPDAALVAANEQATAATRVEHVMGGLNSRYATALELRLLRGLSREVCAAEMDVKLGTFDVVLLRSVRAFRKRWTAEYGDERVG
ncbi:MAG: RNA polymerase sigma factor (sigma-70 family) [Myxococcota bacterium]